MRSVSQRRAPRAGSAGFTLLELLIGISLLATFSVSAIYALTSFNRNAAVNRNATAVMAILQDRMDRVLTAPYSATSTSPLLAATGDGADVDGDGIPDGVAESWPDPSGAAPPDNVPIVVTRDANQTGVVRGTLYRRVAPVGTAYGMANDADLLQVSYLLRYSYRGRNFSTRLVSLKARD